MTLRERASAALARRQLAANGRTITYARGGVVVATFAAWTATQAATRGPAPAAGTTIVRADETYLFTVAAAKAGGLELPPRRGDRITDPTIVDDVTGAAKVFELVTPTGSPAWHYQDQEQTIIRFHAQRAGS